MILRMEVFAQIVLGEGLHGPSGGPISQRIKVDWTLSGKKDDNDMDMRMLHFWAGVWENLMCQRRLTPWQFTCEWFMVKRSGCSCRRPKQWLHCRLSIFQGDVFGAVVLPNLPYKVIKAMDIHNACISHIMRGWIFWLRMDNYRSTRDNSSL